jgi:hypothetical protein
MGAALHYWHWGLGGTILGLGVHPAPRLPMDPSLAVECSHKQLRITPFSVYNRESNAMAVLTSAQIHEEPDPKISFHLKLLGFMNILAERLILTGTRQEWLVKWLKQLVDTKEQSPFLHPRTDVQN